MTSLTRFMVHPITLIEPTMTVNAYGDTVADWPLPATEREEMGWFTRTSTEEAGEGREAITDIYELTVLPTSALTASMRVRYLGEDYEVRGSVEQAKGPGGTHHLVARLRRVEG